jgi:Tfp pilus assembly protein PilV
MRKVFIIIAIVLVAVVLGLIGYLYLAPKFNAENRQIDSWISANNLNKYGDPENTAYSAGKPCDTTLSCYDYIKKMHPDKPWEK